MITFYQNNIWSFIQCNDSERQVCKSILTKSYITFYRIQKKVKAKTRYHCFLSSRGYFLSGLLYYLCKELSKQEIEFTVQDRRRPPVINQLQSTISLREDQQVAIDQILKHSRGIWHIATRGGKSYIAAALIEILNTNSLFLVNRKDLFTQTHKLFEELLHQKIGMIQGDKVDLQKVTIAMQQSVYNKLDCLNEYLKSINLVITDEGHHSKAFTYQEVLKKCNAYYRILMSGTIPPENTLEGMKIRSHAGDVICQVSASQLSEKGLIAMPKFYFIQCRKCTSDLTGYNSSKFQEFFIKGTVDNEYRNELIYELVAKNPNKKIAIIVQFIRHGDILLEMLKKVASCNYIHGNTENNSEVIEDFNLGKFNVLIGSSIIDEGITFPSIDILILVAGGKGGNSSRQLAQRIGRGLDPSHKEVSIFDFDDTYHYVFKAHSRKRRKYIKLQGFNVKLIDKPISIGD